jgi:hypothetical protein
MTDLIQISHGEVYALARLREQVGGWRREHPCVVGVAEMIKGAGILCYGVRTGMIEVLGAVFGVGVFAPGVTLARAGTGASLPVDSPDDWAPTLIVL